MSFPGKSVESRLRQANSRFSTVKNMVNSFGKSLSGLLNQKNYSPPPVPPTTPDSVEDNEDIIVADVAEVVLAGAGSSSFSDRRPSIAASIGGPKLTEPVANDQNTDSLNNSTRRKASQPIPIPKSNTNLDQPERAERQERFVLNGIVYVEAVQVGSPKASVIMRRSGSKYRSEWEFSPGKLEVDTTKNPQRKIP